MEPLAIACFSDYYLHCEEKMLPWHQHQQTQSIHLISPIRVDCSLVNSLRSLFAKYCTTCVYPQLSVSACTYKVDSWFRFMSDVCRSLKQIALVMKQNKKKHQKCILSKHTKMVTLGDHLSKAVKSPRRPDLNLNEWSYGQTQVLVWQLDKKKHQHIHMIPSEIRSN